MPVCQSHQISVANETIAQEPVDCQTCECMVGTCYGIQWECNKEAKLLLQRELCSSQNRTKTLLAATQPDITALESRLQENFSVGSAGNA